MSNLRRVSIMRPEHTISCLQLQGVSICSRFAFTTIWRLFDDCCSVKLSSIRSTMRSRLIQLSFVYIRHTNNIHARHVQRSRQRSTKGLDLQPLKSEARRDINQAERKLGIRRTKKVCGHRERKGII